MHGDHAPLKKDEPLGYGYYPAGRAVKIPITRPSPPGIYRVEIRATFRSGAVSTTELWFACSSQSRPGPQISILRPGNFTCQ
jgi:hypothetical protein